MFDIGPVLADTAAGGHMTGWGWGWMAFGWILMIGIVLAVAWAFWNSSADRPKRSTEILAERYAKGEISNEEYEERLETLRR